MQNAEMSLDCEESGNEAVCIIGATSLLKQVCHNNHIF